MIHRVIDDHIKIEMLQNLGYINFFDGLHYMNDLKILKNNIGSIKRWHK